MTTAAQVRALLQELTELGVEIRTCDNCQGRWLIPSGGPAVLYHRCITQRVGPPQAWGSDPDRARIEWARHMLGGELVAHLDTANAQHLEQLELESKRACNNGHTGSWVRWGGHERCAQCVRDRRGAGEEE